MRNGESVGDMGRRQRGKIRRFSPWLRAGQAAAFQLLKGAKRRSRGATSQSQMPAFSSWRRSAVMNRCEDRPASQRKNDLINHSCLVIAQLVTRWRRRRRDRWTGGLGVVTSRGHPV
ncbi:hypothetical protein SKAU_G00314280 [Synaphobranchus kaupii]|uniref:Uncharacterized protein n=1 Tax=Synaphobranchus kaupii TaxID=118154 RepID=A0A9Q1ESG6_SYNKA|nr:hypothetical protein SKAU_G00314280 [Synaphobranchus kaupii]